MSGAFLPHDTAWLGMTADELGHHHGGRIVGFMFHDRVSFGGTLLAVAVLYVWLARGPIRGGRRWAWWTLAASATAGFLSFLAWLGYGYLDVWHAVGTLLLLPVVAVGLAGTRPVPAWPPEAPWLADRAPPRPHRPRGAGPRRRRDRARGARVVRDDRRRAR